MPALNFQAQFAPLVESGEKRQTIRAYRKDGRDPKPGCRLYLFTGMRTKSCIRLVVHRAVEVIRRAVKGVPFGHVVECVEVRAVSLNPQGALTIDGIAVGVSRYNRLAKADGFVDMYAMCTWFEDTHGLPFEGLLIRW